MSLYNLHIIVILTAKQLNYTVKQLKKASLGVGTEFWQPLRLDLRSLLLDASWVPMQRLTELKINLSETWLQTFSFIFSTTNNQKYLIIASRGNYLWLIAAAWIFKDWPWGCMRGQVCLADLSGRWLMLCTADLYHSAREHWERLWNTWSSLLW